MPYDIAEQVLRATANAMTSSSSSMGEQSGQFRDYAATHAKVIGNAVEADAVGLVIAAAVGGIALSYLAISSQLSAEKNKRLSFDKERIAGIATFTLPKNTLDSDLYKEQRVIKDFIGLAKNADNSSWSTYFCLLYTSPSPRDRTRSRMPSSA